MSLSITNPSLSDSQLVSACWRVITHKTKGPAGDCAGKDARRGSPWKRQFLGSSKSQHDTFGLIRGNPDNFLKVGPTLPDQFLTEKGGPGWALLRRED